MTILFGVLSFALPILDKRTKIGSEIKEYMETSAKMGVVLTEKDLDNFIDDKIHDNFLLKIFLANNYHEYVSRSLSEIIQNEEINFTITKRYYDNFKTLSGRTSPFKKKLEILKYLLQMIPAIIMVCIIITGEHSFLFDKPYNNIIFPALSGASIGTLITSLQ